MAGSVGEEQVIPAGQPDLLHNPVQLVAFGFGAGLSPRAPGTIGTLVAIPIYLLLVQTGWVLYTVFVLASLLVGIWLCGKASAQLNTHDHSGIVWDEFVGLWITLWAIPPDALWIALGFVVFRLLDIVKPWPISFLDRKVHGGWGIMVDDIVAGVMACVTLHIARSFL